MNLLEPIEGDRVAGPLDYFHALTDYDTPLDKYLTAKLGQGWRNSWGGQIATAQSLPDTALFRIGGEPLKAVLGLIPAAKQEPGYAPNQPPSQLPHDIIIDRLKALPEEERQRVLPQVEQALKQRGFKFYTEDEWRASEHYRDMPFEPFMTAERAKAKAEVFDNNRIRDWLIAHRPDGVVSGTLGFLANMVGGLADPTTLAGMGIGGKLLMNLGRSGVANLVKAGGIGALDGAISSLARDYSLRQPLAKWGEDHTDREIWENAGWSALFGAGLGGGFQGARILRAKAGERAYDPRGTIMVGDDGKRIFYSKDPHVAETALVIERNYPGLIHELNAPVWEPLSRRLVTDADIKLTDGTIIQIKSGSGRGLENQVFKTEAATKLPVIGYGPDLGEQVIANIGKKGGLATDDLKLLLDVIKP